MSAALVPGPTSVLSSTAGAAAEPNSFSFDTEDNLIQELLAGIPSTAWLPTDPLTSEGWFTDPMSSVITQDKVFSSADFQYMGAETQACGAEKPGSLTALHTKAPAAAADPRVLQTEGHSASTTATTSTRNQTLAAQPAAKNSAAPDSRLIAALRSKRESRLQNRGTGSHKTNPLFGFAKKHGVGYPVGNQMMAYLSPALLSSSPPNAKQLRTNPYKYYSPPKPTHRAGAAASVKGRNLMLGTQIPSTTTAAMSQKSTAIPKPAEAADSAPKPAPKASTPNPATKARAGVKGIKWEIAQDKHLLRGVREQRWANGGVPRDPSKFSSVDWEAIAQGVTSSGVERNSRQCRRRWAVMHAHLGSAIMDFVDNTLTPHSSAQSTPNRSKVPVASAGVADGVATETANINNPKLANLPLSSPPFMPAFARLRESDFGDHNNSALSSPQLNANEGQLAVVRGSPKQITLDSVDMSQRWNSPAYCQLLADVVQAMSNPNSQAAEVVRKYTMPAPRSKTVSGKDKFLPMSLPEVSLSAVAPVVMSESILATSDADVPALHQVLPASISGVAATAGVDSTRKPSVGNNPSASFHAASDPTLAPMSLTGELDIGVADPDWSMYNQFLQSLGSAHVDLGGDWANIFGDTAAGIGIGQGISEGTSHFGNAYVSSGLSVSAAESAGILTAQPEGAKSSDVGRPEIRAGISSSAIDDDDANDDDFVLDDLEEGDDDEDDEDDEADEVDADADADADAEDAEDADDVEDAEDDGNDDREQNAQNKSTVSSSALKHVSKSLVSAHAAGSGNADSGIAWDLTLGQLGFDLGTSSVLDSVSASTLEAAVLAANVDASNAADVVGAGSRVSGSSNNNVTFAPDPLIQQLLRGAADISNNNNNNGSGENNSSGSKGVLPNAAQSAWLSNALDSTMLPQWNSGDSPSGALSLDAPGAAKTPSGKTGTKKGVAAGSAAKSAGKTPRQGGRVSGQSASGAAATENALAQRPSPHPTQLQQLLLGDIGTPSRRNSLKSARKRLKKKSASASIAKALSAAAMIDMDGLVSNDNSVMDTEMTGLYQDALQEGEELDVQEESLIADNSEYLFTSDQMHELRDQQIQNFQIVTQALLVSCAEVGPHVQRTRHWKQQLDQLALWHLLGTRESPSDLVSSEGLCHFATLIDSAEKMCEQSGSTGITELGRFAPNPASFFAIPGITAVIPDIYEAIDEIHRATQLSAAEPDTKALAGNGNGAATNSADSKAAAGLDGASAGPNAPSSGMAVAAGTAGIGPGAAGSRAPEVRAFNNSMDFTTKCQCTPTNGFKSAMIVQCVFPLLYLQMRNGADGSSGKRKASEVVDAADGRNCSSVVGGGGGSGGSSCNVSSSNKQQAVAPQLEDPTATSTSTAASAGDGSGGLLQPAGVKPLKPLMKPISRQLSGSLLKSRDASCGTTGLPAIMPLISMDNLPSYTLGDVRTIVDEMRSQVRAFKRDLHRVARSRRRIFVQGDDGVPRLEWMQVKIEPLTLPLAMQCLLAPLMEHSGFRESMMPKIVVVRKPKNRIHFLDTEDTLLLQGLRLFGMEDVASIRVHLMPCKTASQLRNRINNLRARRAEANPVKDFCLRRIMPFTLEEEEVLRLGVLVYGDEFNELNQNFLVNRPILALSHMWSHMRNSETAG
ncbi:hypothetical protein LPJ57_002979 [Coemansia sp. RSA 486]|nr:hypothetical protein LPJ57_002979 [Coemansia sp. RSA 486]